MNTIDDGMFLSDTLYEIGHLMCTEMGDVLNFYFNIVPISFFSSSSSKAYTK